jgi:hypothetical protein
MISVANLPNVRGKKIINEFFSEKNAIQMIPEEGDFISFNKITLEGQQGAVLEYEMINERINIKMKTRTLWFSFIYILNSAFE